MKANAVGVLLGFLGVLSFGQDGPGWGVHSPAGRDMDPIFGEKAFAASGRVIGTVVSLDGKPQPDVSVEVRDLGTARVFGSRYTDGSGSFSFDMVPYGMYEVVANYSLSSVREQIDVRDSFVEVSLRLPPSGPGSASGQSALVSVVELRIPKRARDAYLRAQQAMTKHQPEQVAKYIQKALEIYPTYAPALTMRGILTLDGGDTTAAVGDFEAAIRADNSFALAYTGMAAAFNELKKFDDALRAADRATSLSPTSWQPYFEMGKSYIGKADYQGALQQLIHAQQQLGHEYPPLRLARACAFWGLAKYEDAATELKSFLRMAPKDPRASGVRDTLAKISAFIASDTNKPITIAPH